MEGALLNRVSALGSMNDCATLGVLANQNYCMRACTLWVVLIPTTNVSAANRRVSRLWHRGQGESLVPPHTHGSVSLSRAAPSTAVSRGAGQKPGASLHTRERLSLSPLDGCVTGGRAKA